MPKIDRLGFVLDFGSSNARNIVTGVIAHFTDGDPAYWKAYPMGQTVFVPRLFIVSELAYRLLSDSGPHCRPRSDDTSPIRVLIESDDRDLSFLTDYCIDIKTRIRSKDERYASIPKELRSVVQTVFVTQGKKKHATLGIVAHWRAKQFFFWTHDDFTKYTSLPEFPTVTHGSEIVITEHIANSTILDANTLKAITPRVRHATGPKRRTWLELYQHYALESDYAESEKWLTITGVERMPASPDAHEQSIFSVGADKASDSISVGRPVSLPDMIELHRHVLLTGGAGTGKTTALKRLMASLAKTHGASRRHLIPFFVDLKWLEKYVHTAVTYHMPVNAIECLSRCICEFLQARSSAAELVDLWLTHCKHENLPENPSSVEFQAQEALEWMRNDIIREFNSAPSDDREIIILLDCFDGVAPPARAFVKAMITELLETTFTLVIACRSYYADHYFKEWPVTRFELQELTDEQIIAYMDSFPDFRGRAWDIFEQQILPFDRIIALARNPYFLHRLTRQLQSAPTLTLPETRAVLIQSFIKRQIEDNTLARRMTGPSPDEPTVNFVLSQLAHRILQKATQLSTEVGLRFVVDVTDLMSENLQVREVLEAAEAWGIVKKSGIIPENDRPWGEIDFSHDCYRDYFGALYLQNLDRRSLVETLPDYFEHVVWDEPILMFLELNTNGQLAKQVVEFALMKTPFFGICCAGATRALGDDSSMDIALRISRLSLCHNWEQVYEEVQGSRGWREDRPVISVLRHVSARQLVAMARDPKYDTPTAYAAWVALAMNIGPSDLPFLKDLWRQLTSVDDELAGKPAMFLGKLQIIAGASRIPTEEAFHYVFDAYKDLFTFNEPLRIQPLHGVFSGHIAYSPSLSEVRSVLPGADRAYAGILSRLLRKVRDVSTEDIPFLKSLLYHEDEEVAAEAAELLRQTLHEKAYGTILRCFIVRSKKASSLVTLPWRRSLWMVLLDILVEIAPEKISRVLIKLHEKRKPGFSVFQLAQTRTKSALDVLLERACSVDMFCLDLLEDWPNRSLVIELIRDGQEGDPMTAGGENAALVGACLGDDTMFSRIEPILADLFSPTTPQGPWTRRFLHRSFGGYYRDPSILLPSYSLSRLPLAVRAAQRIPSDKTASLILQIIKCKDVTFEVILESLGTLAVLASSPCCARHIEDFLNSRAIKRLVVLLSRKADHGMAQSCSDLSSALDTFCQKVPEEYVQKLFMLSSAQFIRMIARPSSGEVRFSHVSDLIVSLSQRVDSTDVVRFLKILRSHLHRFRQEKKGYYIAFLLEKIQIAKGRRFLHALADGPE